MASEAERHAYAERLAREWAEKGKLVEGGWRALRATILRDMKFDDAEQRDANLRLVYFLACEHLFSCIVGPLMDPGREETEGDLRRMTNIQNELAQFRLQFLAPHKPGTA